MLLIGAVAIAACGTDGDKAGQGNPDAGSGGASAGTGGAGNAATGGAAGGVSPGGAAGNANPGTGGSQPGSGGATPGSGGASSGGVNGAGGASIEDGGAASALTLTSTVFQEGEIIPGSYRCAAPSPDLDWDGGPTASSYAIIFKDVTPGISNGFLHWVLYDVPGSVTALAEGVPIGYEPGVPAGAHQAPIWNRTLGFNGPCGGVNTYELTLYAIDVATLPLTQSSSGAEAVTAIEAHDLASVKMTVRSQP